MKILHCNDHDIRWGAGIAASRLHHALNAEDGIHSIMGVQNKHSDDKDVHILSAMHPRLLQKILIRSCNTILNLHKPNPQIYFSAYLSPNTLTESINRHKPDIIHLHWISHFFSPWTLKKLAKLHIPVIWTMHDTWTFTGGCHFGQCTHWVDACKNCPQLERSFGFDYTNIQWKLKKNAYEKLRPTIVGPSRKITEKAMQSSLCKELSVQCIPNLLNTNIFKPIEKNIAREILGLKQDVQYILFGAMDATSNHNKGYDLLVDALQNISPQKSNMHCLIFGASHGAALPLPSTFLGSLYDSYTLALAYAAADVFICPSREENLPNTVMESLACGTPVVGFNIGGLPDMIEHKENGYLAQPYDTKELAQGMMLILQDAELQQSMNIKARQLVLERFDAPIIAKQYIKLYESLLH